MGRLDYDLSPFQRAKQRFGIANPAEQILMVEERVAKLEAMIKEMVKGKGPEKILEEVKTSSKEVPVKLTRSEQMKANWAKRKASES